MRVYQLYLLISLACAVLAATVAAIKRHSPLTWFLAGWLLNVFILTIIFRLPRKHPARIPGD